MLDTLLTGKNLHKTFPPCIWQFTLAVGPCSACSGLPDFTGRFDATLPCEPGVRGRWTGFPDTDDFWDSKRPVLQKPDLAAFWVSQIDWSN